MDCLKSTLKAPKPLWQADISNVNRDIKCPYLSSWIPAENACQT